MIIVHENVSHYKSPNPIKCPNRHRSRSFSVSTMALVRTAKRGHPPPENQRDIVLLKCRKCGQQFGISIEQCNTKN